MQPICQARRLVCVLGALLLADASAATLDSARAGAGEYIVETSREAIVAKARKEGRVRVAASSSPETIHPLAKAFREKYPFIDVRAAEITREDSQARALQLKAGSRLEEDVVHAPPDLYRDYLPYLKKFDLLTMVEQRLLEIPTKMIDAVNRNVVAMESSMQVAAFNKCLLDPAKVPSTWEDFLKPELKGRKFLVDIRPNLQTVMAAGAGEEWMVSYAKRIAAQQPIWVRGQTRTITQIAAGEYTLHSGAYYQGVVRVMRKDATGCLQAKVIEPVPVRVDGPHAVLETARHPYAGLLWLEFMASPQGQAIIDEFEPVSASVFAPGSVLEKITRGKKVWIRDLTVIDKTSRWMKMAIEAFGFPREESAKGK
ncbi:MAG TPA: ABC transporter substrate-binding protein [Candidatus Acidoferrales bacterium]|nr:ABC transporter substrate-binding protein [Candidatus Acidoferrales bacterium]